MSLKDIRLQARVTEKEYEKIMKKVKNGGYKNLSDYLRDKVVNKEIIEYDFGGMRKYQRAFGKGSMFTIRNIY